MGWDLFRAMGEGVDDVAEFLGYAPKQVDEQAPGAVVDTTQSDEERARLGALLGQLQQQGQTGSGAWENVLRNSTQQNQASAQALGQSQPGVGYSSALRDIANAKGAAQQRSVGQGNILRAQSMAGAQDAATNLAQSMNSGDASAAAAGAAARQGVSELNSTLANKANESIAKDTVGLGGMLSSLMSKGGSVPGKAKVGGDARANDTVPTMLSPGEIVIPRSHASSPEDAAAFVRALQASGGRVQHMADGGAAGDGTGLSSRDSNSSQAADARRADVASIFAPHIGAAMHQQAQSAPSIGNGGLLESGNYDSSRQALLGGVDAMQQRANEVSPAATQQNTNAIDSNLAAAMGAKGRGAAAGNILSQVVAENQGAAGASAEGQAAQNAAARGQQMRALLAQRMQDQAFAQAKQQAAFRQTMLNAGIGLEQQAAMRGLLAGAGQAASAGSSLMKQDNSYDLNDKNVPSWNEGSSSEWSDPYAANNEGAGGAADLHGYEDKAHGGYVGMADGGAVEAEDDPQKAAAFVAALRRKGMS